MRAVWWVDQNNNVVVNAELHKLERKVRDVPIENDNAHISIRLLSSKRLKFFLQPLQGKFGIRPAIRTSSKPNELCQKLAYNTGE